MGNMNYRKGVLIMKKNINHKLEKENKRLNKNVVNLPLKIIITIYLLVALFIMILVAPYAFDSIKYNLIELDGEKAISIFFITLTICSLMIVMLSYMYSKKRTNFKFEDKSKNDDLSMDDFSFYGNYSDERRYLEEKIEELTERLTDTELKWNRINHLILSANEKNIENNGTISSEKFLKEFGIDVNNVELEKDLVFVLSPSNYDFVEDYWIVRETCRTVKMRALRGDETDLNYTHGNILTHIINHMVKARVIIANISNRNPNVYYELGIAHMLGKPTILLCRKGMEAPFDLQQKYIIFYGNEVELSEKLKDALLNIITIE